MGASQCRYLPSISEQAYYRASGKIRPVIGNVKAARLLGKDESPVAGDLQNAVNRADPDMQSPSDEKEYAPAKKYPAQESELVYRIPNAIHDIPFTIESMLSWSDWELQVVDVARS